MVKLSLLDGPIRARFARGPSAKRTRYIRTIDKIHQIPPEERQRLKRVADRYVFRATTTTWD